MVFITREMLDERERMLKADFDAIGGALQEVAFWREILDREEADPAGAEAQLDATVVPLCPPQETATEG